MRRMFKRHRTRLALGAFTALVALNAALWLAQFGLALPGIPQIFGPSMIRAEVVTKDRFGVHDYRVDVGRITAITGRTLTVRERDETVVSVPVSFTARITINGSLATFSQLRRGFRVQTVR